MIELLVLDVDGCLTDGGIIYDGNGVETKKFDVKDGFIITQWHRLGKKSAIITGRDSAIVAHRARELGVTHLYQGVKDKLSILDGILKEEGLTYENVAAIGDDLNDYRLLSCVKYAYTPQNGSHYVKEIVNTILNAKGGEGAVREMIEDLLQKENLESELLSLWQ